MKIEEVMEEEKYIKLRITSMDDLWFLSNFIEIGDTVLGTTFRKGDERNDSIRSKKAERIRMNVGIDVEAVEFQEFTDRLRIRGRIIIGPEEYIGHYQSLNFSVGDMIEIIKKEWSKSLLEDMQASEKKGVQALFISIDDENATVAFLRDYGIQVLAEIRLSRPSKEMDGGEIEYKEVLNKISQHWQEGMPIFLVGPGFFKEEFFKRIQDNNMRKSTVIIDTSSEGERGIYEALSASAFEKILREHRLKEEVELVTSLLDEIGRDGKYAYGIDEVKKYAEMGAIEMLLIVDTKIKDKEFRNIMKAVEEKGGRVKIISSHHEYGRILSHLGGIGALLRYKV